MEQRSIKRWPARLRSAKLFDASQRFLVECRVLDLSLNGARLKPESDRPLPLDIHFQDENLELFAPATIVWVRKGEIGIRFTGAFKAVD
jgi:hypothetical protein